MYWQKRFKLENPDKEIEEKIVEIRELNKDYGYRRVSGELRNQGYIVNKNSTYKLLLLREKAGSIVLIKGE